MALLLVGLLSPAPVPAHALAPTLLQVEAQDDGGYTLAWQRAPADAWADRVRPVPSSGCRLTSPWQDRAGGSGEIVSHARMRCTGAAENPSLRVPGLDRHPATVIVRLESGEAGGRTLLLRGERDRVALRVAMTPWTEIAGSYIGLGIGHLFGADHLLFVLGLFLLVRERRRLLLVTVAFTLGHSLTLALATVGWLRLPQAVAELGIALSLVLLALRALAGRNVPTMACRAGQIRRWRQGMAWAAFAGGFGLLHGLGFAGALNAVGLPEDALVVSLAAFNLGIEAGQLLLLLPLMAARALLESPTSAVRQRLQVAAASVAAYGIGSAGVYWCIDRAVALAGVV